MLPYMRAVVSVGVSAFEPDMALLAGFGLSIRDQRRTSSWRPGEQQPQNFPRLRSLFKHVSRGTSRRLIVRRVNLLQPASRPKFKSYWVCVPLSRIALVQEIQRSVFRADISHVHAASPVKPANHESRRVDKRRLVGPRLHGSRYTQCSPLFLPASKTLFPRKPWPEPRVPISFLGFAWKPLVVEQLWCAMVTFRGLLFQSGTITTSQRIQFREAKIQKQHILNGTHTYRRHLSHHNFRVLKTREVHNGLQTETESEIR
jgi:hypothetical protein